MWLFKFPLSANACSQILQVCSLIFKWMLFVCWFRLVLVGKADSHNSHGWSLTFRWTVFTWWVKSLFLWNALAHFSQGKSFPSFKWIAMSWYPRPCFVEHIMPHFSHLTFLLKCTRFWCALRWCFLLYADPHSPQTWLFTFLWTDWMCFCKSLLKYSFWHSEHFTFSVVIFTFYWRWRLDGQYGRGAVVVVSVVILLVAADICGLYSKFYSLNSFLLRFIGTEARATT